MPHLEVFFSDTAGRAGPVIGDILEWGAWHDSVFRVALCRIVDVSAGYANIFVHNVHLLKFKAPMSITAPFLKNV